MSEDSQPPGHALEVIGDAQNADGETPDVAHPTKLMRIALMLREMQEEVRRADTDGAGRQRLRQIHERSVEQMKSVLSGDLQQELEHLVLPFDDETPTESEIRIAQAQLIGWLEGLFQGIQAAIFNQQLQAREQLEQMRSRGLPPGMPPQGPQAGQEQPNPRGTGHYL